MFNPNEEIQIVGYSLSGNSSLQDKLLVEDGLTEINKRLELKNRHNELQIKNTLLQQKIDKALGFLENCNTKDEQLAMYVIKMLKGEE